MRGTSLLRPTRHLLQGRVAPAFAAVQRPWMQSQHQIRHESSGPSNTPSKAAVTPEAAAAPKTTAIPDAGAISQAARTPEASPVPRSAAIPEASVPLETPVAQEVAAIPKAAAAPDVAATPKAAVNQEAAATPKGAVAPKPSAIPEAVVTPKPSNIAQDSAQGRVASTPKLAPEAAPTPQANKILEPSGATQTSKSSEASPATKGSNTSATPGNKAAIGIDAEVAALAPERSEAEESSKDKMLRYPRSLQALHLQPLRREVEYGIPSCDLQMRSYSARPLEFFCDFALRAAYYLGLPAFGPVPLPKIVERWTVPRSHFIYKKSQENYERITLRRLIQIRDGHPETVQIWLAFLQKHAYSGVGMKANMWEFGALDAGKELDETAKAAVDALDTKWAHLAQSKPLAPTAKEVEDILVKERVRVAGGR